MFMNSEELHALLNRQEDLCDELMTYYREAGNGNTFATVRHPLVFSVPHFDGSNALLNKQLEVKKQAAKQMMEEKDYAGYIFLHEKPYRYDSFREVCEKLSDQLYWEMLADVWTNSENIWQNRNGWIQLLSESRPGKNQFFMDDEERLTYNALSDVVTCHRGYTPGKNMNGISYTLSYEKAQWFANRFSKNGKVITLKVPKIKIFAYLSGRNEQEVIII